VLVDVRQRAPTGHLGDLAVAEAGDQESEVAALALGQGGQQGERFARFQQRIERARVGGGLAPVAVVGAEPVQACVAVLNR
jgi:hypothetical protein